MDSDQTINLESTSALFFLLLILLLSESRIRKAKSHWTFALRTHPELVLNCQSRKQLKSVHCSLIKNEKTLIELTAFFARNFFGFWCYFRGFLIRFLILMRQTGLSFSYLAFSHCHMEFITNVICHIKKKRNASMLKTFMPLHATNRKRKKL